jgi:uncharacterized membrane protein
VKKILTILIGFIHDWAAGCWAATVLGVYWLNSQPVTAGVGDVLFALKKQFFFFGIGCVIVVFATGAGRTFTYVDNVYGQDAEKIRRKMLMIKHLLLLLVFGSGIFWQYTMVFK